MYMYLYGGISYTQEEARHRQAKLQEAVEKATEDALHAKMATKSSATSTITALTQGPLTSNVTFDLQNTYHDDSGGVTSDNARNDSCSPNLLQPSGSDTMSIPIRKQQQKKQQQKQQQKQSKSAANRSRLGVAHASKLCGDISDGQSRSRSNTDRVHKCPKADHHQQPQHCHHQQQQVVGMALARRGEGGRDGMSRRRQEKTTWRARAGDDHTVTLSTSTSDSSGPTCGSGSWQRGGREGVSPPVPALARKMKKSGQQHYITATSPSTHSRAGTSIHKDVPPIKPAQVSMSSNHASSAATHCYDSLVPPTVLLSSWAGDTQTLSPSPAPVLVLRCKKIKNTSAVVPATGQHDHSQGEEVSVPEITRLVIPPRLPPVAMGAESEEGKPPSHRQQVILQELAQLRQVRCAESAFYIALMKKILKKGWGSKVFVVFFKFLCCY